MSKKYGKIELILGPMFSGKSSELIKKIRLFTVLKKNVIVIKPNIDNRYSENSISTHDKVLYKSINVNTCSELKEKYLTEYNNCDIIVIEEGQFLSDIFEFVVNSADNDYKHIIVAGLNGDYNKNKIGDLTRLIPHADNIEHKLALCNICNDGTLAPFTFKKIKDDNQVLIGGEETYIPLCRYHWGTCCSPPPFRSKEG